MWILSVNLSCDAPRCDGRGAGGQRPVIEALRARRKEVFIQERYGRFNLNDPFLALQRDYEAGAGDKEKKPVCTKPLSILEAVMAHCRKMQERMSAQLAAAESRQKKVLRRSNGHFSLNMVSGEEIVSKVVACSEVLHFQAALQ
ncbi:hypothetical protein P7K49_000827 [Saguinus oedipus]|uniref:Cortactin-binding protein-2 N-terminal domain-containing protein n=1 Tax=Saguinus oedipus TaxID=9490 RepID=A0ABQ9WCV3_SAGOE|nr:hypothetical protein P7K49_000827 [Saguinus oedipus]